MNYLSSILFNEFEAGMYSSAGNGLVGRIQLKMPKICAEFNFSLATDLLHGFHHNW